MPSKLVLLFDLDGTLLDTDPLHVGAYATLLGEMGRSLSMADYRAHVMGAANADIMAYLFPDQPADGHFELLERKEALVRAGMDVLAPTPGLLDVLAWAADRDVPCGVVTNAPRANADKMLAGLGLSRRFPVVVIGDELARGKPDPLPYLTGLQRLGGEAAHAVAFEDSRAGIRSATAAGIYTFALRTALADDVLRAAGADAIITDFTDPALRAFLEARLSGS